MLTLFNAPSWELRRALNRGPSKAPTSVIGFLTMGVWVGIVFGSTRFGCAQVAIVAELPELDRTLDDINKLSDTTYTILRWLLRFSGYEVMQDFYHQQDVCLEIQAASN